MNSPASIVDFARKVDERLASGVASACAFMPMLKALTSRRMLVHDRDWLMADLACAIR